MIFFTLPSNDDAFYSISISLTVKVLFNSAFAIVMLFGGSVSAQKTIYNLDSLHEVALAVEDFNERAEAIASFRRVVPSDSTIQWETTTWFTELANESKLDQYLIYEKYYQGLILLNLGHYKKAKDPLLESISLYSNYEDGFIEYNGPTLVDMHYDLSASYNYIGDNTQAIIMAEKAHAYAVELGDTLYQGRILFNLGIYYYTLGQIDKGIEYYFKTKNTFDLLPDDEDAVNYSIMISCAIGSAYVQQDDLEKAKPIFEKFVVPNLDIEDYDVRHKLLLYYGVYCRKTKNYSKGIEVLTKCYENAINKNDNYGKCYALYDLATIYNAQGDLKKGRLFADELKNTIKSNDYYGTKIEGLSLLAESDLAIKTKNYNVARIAMQKNVTLQKRHSDHYALYSSYKELADLEIKAGKPDLAYKYLMRYQELKDSTENVQFKISQEIQSIEYETEKKEKEILKLKNQDLENQASYNKQRNLLTTSLMGLSLLGFLAFMFYRNSKKANRNNKLLEEKNAIIETKSNQNETLLKEIHHRVKNNLQTISSLLYLQSANITDEDAKEAIAQGQHRVESMALIHKNLYQRDNLAGIEMKDYISRLVSNLESAYGTKETVEINIKMDEAEVDVDTAIPLGLIINELLTNVFKYAFPDDKRGSVDIVFRKNANDKFYLQVSDNGVGKRNATEGFGTQLVNLLAKQLEASFSENNSGDGYSCDLIRN